jgi:endonuclease/exonuclease/phosphatase family metal-dependent hydrolase
MVDESYFEELDRDFLKFSSVWSNFASSVGNLGTRLVSPLEPEKYDSATSLSKEVAVRAFIVAGFTAGVVFAGAFLAIGAVALGLGSTVFRAIGFALQKEGFTHVRGSAPEKTLVGGEAKVMTWNLRERMAPWSYRIEKIAEEIVKENPDVLVLQEVYDVAFSEALIEQLKGHFAHFYTYLGASVWGDTGGCMVLTKCAVQTFSHTDFVSNEESCNRGFDVLEIKAKPEDLTPCARIIGTQLTPGKGGKEMRMHQIAQIVNRLGLEKLSLPTFFAGNLNTSLDSEEGVHLSGYLYHSYRENEPTSTKEASDDLISFFKRRGDDERVLPVIERNIHLLDCHLAKTALSDHHAVVTRFKGLRAVP